MYKNNKTNQKTNDTKLNNHQKYGGDPFTPFTQHFSSLLVFS